MTNEKLHWNKTNYSVNQIFEKPQTAVTETKDFKIHLIEKPCVFFLLLVALLLVVENTCLWQRVH